MATTLIVGDGPAGLSAGLLLAKKGETALIFGKDGTKMRQAHLYNYPGIREIDGDKWVDIAIEQCEYFGAEFHDKKIVHFERAEEGFKISAEDKSEFIGNYLIITTGHFMRDHPPELGIESDDEGRIIIDDHSRTNVDGVYAAGVVTRTDKIQATISVGQGASAALDIIDKEQEGRPQDFDTKIE